MRKLGILENPADSVEHSRWSGPIFYYDGLSNHNVPFSFLFATGHVTQYAMSTEVSMWKGISIRPD